MISIKFGVCCNFLTEGTIRTTSLKASNMSMLGWWMVHTVVLPVATTFFTTRITIAAALASKPDVGSSIKIIEGLETSSTAIVSLLRCSVERPLWPGMPTKESFIPSSSIVSMTSSTNLYMIDMSRLLSVHFTLL
jgi:hypothetical protein